MKWLWVLLTLTACANPRYADGPLTSADNTSCELKIAEHCFNVQWNVGPNTQEENSFKLEVVPALNAGEQLSIVLWMPSMNHGSAPVTITDQGQGVFLVQRVFFIMPGDWEVRFQLKNSQQENLGQTKLEFILP